MSKKRRRSGKAQSTRVARSAGGQQAISRGAKRARFVQSDKKQASRSPYLALIVAVAVLAIGSGIYVALPRSDSVTASVEAAPTGNPDAPKSDVAAPSTRTGGTLRAATTGHAPYPEVVAQNGVVQLPLSTFEDGKAHYYTHMNGSQPIELFVLKSNDGIVRAAFNACDVCFQSKRGYTQDGDEMVCNNCGRRFPSDSINVIQGGCNPSPLDRTEDGDMLLIQVDDIVNGASYF